MEKTHPPTQVAMIPSPGLGHLIPLVALAKRLLIHQPNFSITFLLPTYSPPSTAQTQLFNSLPPSISFHVLPQVDLTDLEHPKIETLIFLTVTRSLPFIREALNSIILSGASLSAVVCDTFGTDIIQVAREFNASPYLHFLSSAMALSFTFYLPKLDEEVSCEYRELETLVKIPGSVSIHGRDLLDPVQDRKNDVYKWLLYHTKRFHLFDGILVNSFLEMETEAFKAVQEYKPGRPPVYPVGPLVQVDKNLGRVGGSECLKWLDDQPLASVLHVSFGSGGTLSYDQTTELAWGLEMSQQRFLWVVRSPNDTVPNGSYISGLNNQEDPFTFLPKGFLERTKSRGLVVPSWVPQAQVLNHGSTGGFLSHCGWNSTLESIVSGVPLIAWPLHAEQKMNAVLLTDDIKVALRPKANAQNGLVGREEISNVVRSLMEGDDGKRVRSRMMDLKNAASRALSEDGSSNKALAQVVSKWRDVNCME